MKFRDLFGKITESSCGSCEVQAPPTVHKPEEGASASLGQIRWSKKMPGETNYSSAQDADIRLEDSQIEVLVDAKMSSKILKINDQFSFMVSYGEDPKKGFGLTLKIADEKVFGWDWFYFAEDNYETAFKLQEGGKLEVEFAEVEGRAEIIRIRFETDICLRGYDMKPSAIFKIATRSADSRLLIKHGSDIQVPVLHDEKVTLLLSGA